MELEYSLGEKKIVILVGCKSDLAENRQVDYSDGERTAESFEAPYLETSSKENKNIEEVFELALIQVFKKEQKQRAKTYEKKVAVVEKKQPKNNDNACCSIF